MRIIAIFFVFLFALFPFEFLFAFETCRCPSYSSSGTVLTVYTWYVEGGCCSGIAIEAPPAGSIGIYEANEAGTWLETDYHLVSNEFAQSENPCCP